MNTIYKFFILAGFLIFAITACEDEYGPRKESEPVFESVTVDPVNFTFGDSISLHARITDPATMLTTLNYEVVSGSRVITSGEVALVGDDFVVAHSIFVPLLNNQDDNADVTLNLKATNVLKGSAMYEVTGLKGSRPVYSQLYLVTEDGAINILEAQAGATNSFINSNLTMDPNFRYKIAEKLTDENTIDYSGDVFGNENGKLSMINETGETAFIYTPDADYTREFIFDSHSFQISTTGSNLGEADLALSAFDEEDINGENFRTLKRTLEKGKSYLLFGKLAEEQNIYNPDFFERDGNTITFLGETGEYTIYYNPVRKNIFVGVDNPSYPDYLLISGWGLGYPTKITSEEINAVYPGHKRTHTDWGFGHVMNYVLLRKVEEGVYQGTFYTPAEDDHYAGFKPFENTGWGNEKKAGDFTFTGEQIVTGDNDWVIPNGEEDPVIESAFYRFTINLNENTVHIEKVTL